MMAARLVWYVFCLGGLAFFLTQTLIPFITGRPLFPFFRRRGWLESELAKAREARDEARLEQELATEYERTQRARHRTRWPKEEETTPEASAAGGDDTAPAPEKEKEEPAA